MDVTASIVSVSSFAPRKLILSPCEYMEPAVPPSIRTPPPSSHNRSNSTASCNRLNPSSCSTSDPSSNAIAPSSESTEMYVADAS